MPASKDEIAAKFLELASRYGYRRTSVEDVARALRISKKTVYDHFASKEDLLRCAVEMAATAQRRRVESMLTAGTALGRIEQVVTMALTDARVFYEANRGDQSDEPAEVTAQVNAQVFGPMVRDLVTAGVRAGEFDVADVDLAAKFAMAVGLEAVRLIREDPSCEPESEAVEAIARLLAGKVADDER